MNAHYSLHDIQTKLYPVLEANHIVRAVVFGSYAKGNASEFSDLDLMIDSGGKVKGIDFYGILEEMVSALNMKVDLIEASQLIEGGRVQSEIQTTGVIIYGK